MSLVQRIPIEPRLMKIFGELGNPTTGVGATPDDSALLEGRLLQARWPLGGDVDRTPCDEQDPSPELDPHRPRHVPDTGHCTEHPKKEP
jgi:hypothetical protein